MARKNEYRSELRRLRKLDMVNDVLLAMAAESRLEISYSEMEDGIFHVYEEYRHSINTIGETSEQSANEWFDGKQVDFGGSSLEVPF